MSDILPRLKPWGSTITNLHQCDGVKPFKNVTTKIIMLSVKELVGEISRKSGKSEEEIKEMIKDKQLELSGLVSAEGAAYIVGRELGVELIRDTQRGLKIKNIVPDMRSVNIVAKVVNVFEPREFEKNGKKGLVASMMLGDETGVIRFPLWNEEVKLIKSTGINQGDVVEISGGWAKKDNRSDSVELRLGKRGKIRKLKESERPEMKEIKSGSPDIKMSRGAASRVSIRALKPGMNAKIRGCIVQVYRKKPYFEVCPNCGSRAEERDGKFFCKDHGAVEPVCNSLLSSVVDDGTGNIRVVFFRQQAEKIFGKSAAELKKEFSKIGADAFWDNFPCMGKEFVVEGIVKTNEFSKEPEMLANNVMDVDIKGECESLMKSL